MTPTATALELTVSTLLLPDDHCTPSADVMSCLEPSGIVATADIWIESVRPTAQGSGLMPMAETLDDGVELPQALTPRATTNA